MKSVNLFIKQRIHFAIVFGLFSAMVFSSCNKDENILDKESLAAKVEGTYTGILKSSTTSQSRTATIEVLSINDSLVTMHCVANGFDSTIVVQLYQNYDSIMVCYTGQDFINQYGHNTNNYDFCTNRQSNWMSNGNCRGNNTQTGSEQMNAWTNHMNTQHDPGDQHYGGFNPVNLACTYSFKVDAPNSTFYTETFSSIIN